MDLEKLIQNLQETIHHSRSHTFDSREGENLNVRVVWKHYTPTLMEIFQGFKTSVEEITVNVVETAKNEN